MFSLPIPNGQNTTIRTALVLRKHKNILKP